MDQIPPIVPALPKAVDRSRNLPVSAVGDWLGAGWRDLWTRPGPSLLYGLGVATLCMLTIWGMFEFGWDHILFPALSGLLILGPALAVGLYEKSRHIAHREAFGLRDLLVPSSGTGYHILFVGAVLVTLLLLWMRAAVLLFALFWGWQSFPGFDDLTALVFGSPTGWALLATGTLVGGLFAALGFAISAFSIPALLDRKLDAFTAMGLSMTYVWHNLPVVLAWGLVVLLLSVLSLATGFVALIVTFPWLAHSTWHAYLAIRDPA